MTYYVPTEVEMIHEQQGVLWICSLVAEGRRCAGSCDGENGDVSQNEVGWIGSSSQAGGRRGGCTLEKLYSEPRAKVVVRLRRI